MKIHFKLNKFPDRHWDDRLLTSEYGTYYQSKQYAISRNQILGHTPKFLVFYADEEIIGQLLYFQNKFGLASFKNIFGEGRFYSMFSKFSSNTKQALWSYGPIIFNDTYKEQIMKKLNLFLDNKKFSFQGHLHPQQELNFDSSFKFDIIKRGTFIINLQNDLKIILENTDKKSVQKNIKRAEERGIVIKKIESKKDMLTHFELLSEHRKRNNLKFTSMNNTLKHFLIGKNGITGFIAFQNNKAVGSITISFLNGYIIEQGIARSTKDIEERLYSQELLRWSIIKWGNKKGYRFYDLAGVSLENRTKKEDGIYRNKAKWGGILVTYSTFRKK
jgi:lipid II:glycine glycyltransferase (peptidoglycan interpeptide bridge formation enzyme)